MTFKDIFKSNFIENVQAFSMLDAVITVFVSIILGYIIFLVHKKTYRGVMYSIGFGTTIIAMTVITSVLIVAVTSNVVLSLGMVGALSIVRFRTAVKEPLDVAFLFWAIATGIIVGAGLIPLAVFATVIMALFLSLILSIKSKKNPYVLVFTAADEDAKKDAMNCIKNVTNKFKEKSITYNNELMEVTVEIYVENTNIANELKTKEKIFNVMMISFNGDYMD